MSRHRAPVARHPVRRALARGSFRLARTALLIGAAAALAPVTLVAVGAFTAAWWRGAPPRRALLAAGYCLPMVAAWLAATAAWHVPARAGAQAGARAGAQVGARAGAWWQRLLSAPPQALLAWWRLDLHGHLAAGAVAAAPPAVPLGLLAGAACWAYRGFRMRSGAGGLTPQAPGAFDARQWRHQVRGARALIAAPGSLPLLSRRGQVVAGATIRAVGHRPDRAAAIPYERLRAHQVVIGSTGTGKTTLLLRLWAGFMAAGLRRYAAGAGRRPLLVVLDCKGGASSRKVADRTRRVLRDAGARSTAIWPDEASLSLWTLPPDRLVTTLLDLIEHGTGGAAYYVDVMEALVALAVGAPCGPPVNAADFLARLDADWLAAQYGASGDGDAVATIRSGRRAIADVKLRFRALWRRLGTGLDGGASLADADAWYCVLEGTAESAVAEAQARALTDLLAFHALRGDREILLCVDEFSAVSRRLPIWRLYERARSLGLAVQVSAQSWEGLAGTEDERRRVAATAEGGIWLLRTPRPAAVAELAGTAPAVDTSRRFSGAGAWDGEGASRARRAPVLDEDLVRRLEIGQVCYVYRGGVTFLQIKRLTGQQAAIGPAVRAQRADDGRHLAGARPGETGEPPTLPLPAIGAAPPWADAAWPGAGPPGTGPSGTGPIGGGPGTRPAGATPGAGYGTAPPAWPMSGTALPDVGEVLDEAFGERRE